MLSILAIYTLIICFLFILAISLLIAGVSNDAVNFLAVMMTNPLLLIYNRINIMLSILRKMTN